MAEESQELVPRVVRRFRSSTDAVFALAGRHQFDRVGDSLGGQHEQVHIPPAKLPRLDPPTWRTPRRPASVGNGTPTSERSPFSWM
jgi:hypothetical protein